MHAEFRSVRPVASFLPFALMATVGIIGAGIAGLTAAHHLSREGAAVSVFEATSRPGGMIRSERTGGYVLEHGPNTLQTSSPLLETLIANLGLGAARIEADAAAKKRYVVKDDRPVALPASPLGFLTTPLFSWKAKLRLLAEPLIPAAAPGADKSAADETVAAFARRRLGQEALDYGLNPFVAGVFAGDPEGLSLRHALPRLHALEQEYGSLLGGLLRRAVQKRVSFQRKNLPARRSLFSFEDGLQQLPDALAAALGERLHLKTPVTALRRDQDRWILMVRRGEGAEEHAFDAVVCTAPLHRLGALRWDAGLNLDPLARVSYPPVSLVYLGLRRADVEHPLDGFGMLVPAAEARFRILGTLFSSSVFPSRAPAGHVLLTTFVGGARHPDLGWADAATQQRVALEDLRRLLGVRGAPAFAHCVHWPQAIPQYAPGYGRVKALLGCLEAQNPGLFLAGNFRQGISLGDAAASGDAAAQRAMTYAGGSS